MKKLFILMFLFLSNPLFAAFQTVNSYTNLVTSLENGSLMRTVIFFKKCTLLTKESLISDNLFTQGFTIDAFSHEINELDQIEISKSFFSIVEKPTFGKVIPEIHLRFISGATVNVSYHLLKPVDKSLLYQLDYVCQMGPANQDSSGIVLYKIISDGSSNNATVPDNSGNDAFTNF